MKKFMIPPEEIRAVAEGYGLCMAPDTVLVQGMPVRYMYRVMPSRLGDSGWRFFAGSETPAYLSDSHVNGIYDVNIVANYCPDIIPFLGSPPYSAYEKTDDGIWVDISLSTDWTKLA